MRHLILLQLLCLALVACGKHDVDSFGFTKETNVNNGQKPTTAPEMMKAAIEQNDKVTFDKLLAEGLDVNTVLNNGRTLLIHAIYNQNALFVDILLKKGADPEIKSQDGKSALAIAIELKQSRIQLMLDPTQMAQLQAELFRNISEDIEEVDPETKRLLEAGTNPNFRDAVTGETPLTLAIKNLSLATVRLINWNDPGFGVTITDVNMPNASGESPLTLANAVKKPAFKKKFVDALTLKNAVETLPPQPEETP